MVKTLTLDQVRKAGRFAWHEYSCLYVPGHGFLFVVQRSPLYLEPVDWNWDTTPHETGWHHLPGCDCEFCRPDENHT